MLVRLHVLVVCTGLLCGAAFCPDPDVDGGVDGGPVVDVGACTLGTNTADGDFVALADNDPVELVMGFQGQLWVSFRVRTEKEPPSSGLEAAMSLTVGDWEPLGTRQPSITYHAEGAGFETQDLQLVITRRIIDDYIDKAASVVVRLEQDGVLCTTAKPVVLVNADPCVHTGEEPICPDGGTP
jgi:hypothetical protein